MRVDLNVFIWLHIDIMCPDSNQNDFGNFEGETFQCAWHRRATSLELTEQYLKERLQAKERQLEAIFQSPAWKISKPLRFLNLIAWKLKPELERNQLIPLQAGLNISGQTVVNKLASQVITSKPSLASKSASRYAIFATWLSDGHVSKSTELQVQQLNDSGYSISFVCALPENVEPQIPNSILDIATVISKPNIGYDFGSWAIGIANTDFKNSGSEVLLINDSALLVNSKFNDLIISAQNSPFDITSVTDSPIHSYHLQSYFLHFKNGSFAHPEIQNLLLNVREQPTKEAVIFAYELGLSRVARDGSLLTGSLFPWNAIRNHSGNPSVESWKELISHGSPLVKLEAIRNMREDHFRELVALVRSDSKYGHELEKDFHKVRGN